MDRKSLKIAEPCDASWDHMHGDEQRRFCDSCTKHVHHLSQMTRREAETLLTGQDGLCVRYSYDTFGQVKFAKKRVVAAGPAAQARGVAVMLAQAASIATALSACAWPIGQGSEPAPTDAAPHHEVQPKGETVGVQPEGSGEAKPDEPCTPPTDPEPHEPIMMGEPVWEPELMEMGDVAIDLDPLYQQEQLAAETLSQFNVTLEEEELVPCEAKEEVDVEVEEVQPVMGRMPSPRTRGGLAPIENPRGE